MHQRKWSRRKQFMSTTNREIYADDVIEAFNLANGYSTRTVPNVRLVRMKPKFTGVGRNQPCPCESGKKFKACCIRALVEIEEPATE